jgi:hypothetical protein
MDRRRIVLRDCAGAIIASLDVSDIDNASALAIMTLEVQTRCDLGDWHTGQTVCLSPWGNAVVPFGSIASWSRAGGPCGPP